MSDVRISVCVSTRDRGARLARLLAALRAQTLPASAFEVAVVDDGSSDDTWSVLTAARDAGDLHLVPVRHATSRGPAAGRNAAWRAARGEVIAFTDDDCVPASDWLEQALIAIGDRPRVVVGRVDAPPEHRYLESLLARGLVAGPREVRWFATANVIYRRADLEALGGFHEDFPNAAWEDTELGLRAEDHGLEVVFGSHVVVEHDVTPASAWDKARDQKRWGAAGLVVKLHPRVRSDLLYRRVFWKRTHLELLVGVAGVGLAARDRRFLALTLPWLHARLCREARGHPVRELAGALPALALVDAAEVVTMARASIEHRTPIL
ncbi:MAG TPA: glycosyltransferase [Mycobacteriales bacterium]|nr:glycosyltransferase [Mycobacteriales bacterium]